MSATARVHNGRGGLGFLRALVILLATAPVLFPPATYSVVPDYVRLLSGILWMLCWVPAFVYLSTPADRRPPLPLIPIIGVAHGLYYALQLTLGVDNANQVWMITLSPLDPRSDYKEPIELALLGWICLLVGYYTTRMLTQPKPLSLPRGLRIDALRFWATRLLVVGVLMEVIRQALEVPVVFRGVLHFATVLAQVGMAILVVLNVRGLLQRRHQAILYAGLAVIILLAIGTGSIASGVFAALTAVLALWVGGQRMRVWWVVIAIAAASGFVALRGVAMDYRRIAWFTNEELPVAKRSQVILGILASRVQQDGVIGAVAHGWEVVATRSANLDLFADVVRRTPRQIPYWNGQTYLSLIGIAVPRVLWPNKPQKQLGQAFGHRYGYLGVNDRSTAINLPFFIEFYCNFGAWGVLLGMVLVGFLYAALEQRLNTAGQGVLVSVCAIVLLLPLTHIESDFSLSFGGLLLNGIALWVVLKFIGRSSQLRTRARAGAAPATAMGRVGA